MGTQAVVEGIGAELWHHLGQGLPCRGVCRVMGLDHRELGPLRAIGVDEIAVNSVHEHRPDRA
jgi:hypothetical protein